MNSYLNIDRINLLMKDMGAAERIEHASDLLDNRIVLTTSGGATSAILPHLTRCRPIPVIFIDTGFYPEQTYAMVKDRLQTINPRIMIYPPPMPRANVEKRYPDWGNPQSEDYKAVLELVKVGQLNRALKDFSALAWMSGVMATWGGRGSPIKGTLSREY